jgi:hypothetical protein
MNPASQFNVRRLFSHFSICMTSRRWCFTLNNPNDNEYPERWNYDKIKLMVCQMELGEMGTLHLQGYIEMNQPTRLSGMKSLLPRAHLEKANGTKTQCISYCLKSETSLGTSWIMLGDTLKCSTNEDPDEYDSLMNSLLDPTNGTKSSTKSRLCAIQSRLCEGNSDEIENIADNEFDLWVRYYRAFEKYALMKTPARNWKTNVHVLQGPTGTGKSKWAMDNYPNAYWKQRSNWWDGYQGHDTVVMDEFYGWIPFDLLLRICDRYPLLVETKGGQVQFVAKTIVFTTNMLPCNWYKSCYFPSFARRVDQWHIMPVWGEHRTYCDYGEFLKFASENVISP